MLQVSRSGMTVSQDFENEDEDVVQALQAAMIASQAGSDKKSVLKVRAASQSIDGESNAQSTVLSFYVVACHCTAGCTADWICQRPAPHMTSWSPRAGRVQSTSPSLRGSMNTVSLNKSCYTKHLLDRIPSWRNPSTRLPLRLIRFVSRSSLVGSKWSWHGERGFRS
jgi:hypothetical protein